jgi:hypothetical protein
MPDWVKDKLSIAMPEGGPPLPINTPPAGGAVRKAATVAGIMASAITPAIIPAVAKASDTSRVTPLSVAAAANPGAALIGSDNSPATVGTSPVASLSKFDSRTMAPVTVNVTINGLAEVDAVRLAVEGAVRQAMADWEADQESGHMAALTD